MKSKIFLYLFVLALLYVLFQQVNAKKKFEFDAKKIELLNEKIVKQKTIQDSLENEILDMSYFSLQHDEYATEYVEEIGLTNAELEEIVTDVLISNNSIDKDNSLVPVAGMSGNTKIDRIKLLNHKWAIVDFTDGKYWGQVLYSFQLDNKETITIDVLSSHIYPKNN